MKAVVMAGGEGSRLRPLTINRPKPMVPLVNKPVMVHILDLLKKHDITDVVVTLQYMADRVQDYFGDGSAMGMKINYSIEEVPLGTAGSVKNAQAYLDETFIVISISALLPVVPILLSRNSMPSVMFMSMRNFLSRRMRKSSSGSTSSSSRRVPDWVMSMDGQMLRFTRRRSR